MTEIELKPSISAQLRQKVHLLGHELVGKGSYEQVGRREKRQFRLELRMPVGEGMSSFERIQTGKYLWICEELGGQTSLSKIDVEYVRHVLAQRGGKRSPVSASTGIAMPFEGLPKMLANLNEAFQFVAPREGRLDQFAVWQLEGTWKPAVLAAWAGKQKDKVLAGEPIDWKALPQQLPQRVVLTIGHDDLFPYRIEYFREGQPGDGSTANTIATLEFFEVRLGGLIPAGAIRLSAGQSHRRRRYRSLSQATGYYRRPAAARSELQSSGGTPGLRRRGRATPHSACCAPVAARLLESSNRE